MTTDDYILFNILIIVFLSFAYFKTSMFHRLFKYALTSYVALFVLWVINAITYIRSTNEIIINLNYNIYNVLPIKLSEFENIYMVGFIGITGFIIYLVYMYRGK
jgi:hypothetical protein